MTASRFGPLVRLGDGKWEEQDFLDGAYSINDQVGLSDDVREQQLINLFADNGHELEFVDYLQGTSS